MNTRASASPQKAALLGGRSASSSLSPTSSRSASAPSRHAANRPGRGKSSRPSAQSVNRFLQSQVGEPWLATCTKAREHFKLESLGQDEVLRLLDVAHRTVTREGKVRVQDSVRGVLGLDEVPQHYYVDPQDKTLRLNEARLRKEQLERERRARDEKEAQSRRRDLGEDLQAHKVGDKWLVAQLAELSSGVFDVLLSRRVSVADRAELQRLYGRAGVYASQKRELSYRELRQLELA